VGVQVRVPGARVPVLERRRDQPVGLDLRDPAVPGPGERRVLLDQVQRLAPPCGAGDRRRALHPRVLPALRQARHRHHDQRDERGIVNFANTEDAAAWLAARSAGVTGPLPTSATGPASRTAREEELLAFLAREPGRGTRLAGMAGPATFTTHLRAELFAALRWATAAGGTPGYSVIAEAYGRRLLRVPADAAKDIGWPNATRAMAYLNRLGRLGL
jgi:hypothetical protein